MQTHKQVPSHIDQVPGLFVLFHLLRVSVPRGGAFYILEDRQDEYDGAIQLQKMEALPAKGAL